MAKSPSLEGMSQIGSPVGSPAGPSGNDGSADATTSALDLGPPATQQDGKDDVHSRAKGSKDQMPSIDGSVKTGEVTDDIDKTK
jgi:hypothetical protein